MAKANYTVEGNKVIANIAELTEKELTAVKNYMALGYTLEEKKVAKKTKSINTKAITPQHNNPLI